MTPSAWLHAFFETRSVIIIEATG